MSWRHLTAIIVAVFTIAACEQPVETYEAGKMKGRWMEAQTNLPAMAASQTGYKAINQKFAASFNDMEYSMTGQTPNYSYFLGDDVIKGVMGPDSLPEGLDMVEPDENSFVIFAVANLDTDPDLDVWAIDQDRNLRHIKNDQ